MINTAPAATPGQSVREESVADDGQTKSVSSYSSQTLVDPHTGSTTVARQTSMWTGRDLALDLLWFAMGVIALFLAGDFIFHLAGANNTGFVKFVYSVGSWFARPFAGIFNNASPQTGNLVVWADVLAVIIYAIVAAVLAKLYTILASRRVA